MKTKPAFRAIGLWDPAGSHATELARKSAPGPGMGTVKRWCCRCGQHKPLQGSRVRGELFTCSTCRTSQ